MGQPHLETPRVAVVIPCYRVRERILDVIAAVGPEVSSIVCVDDACPEGTGAHVSTACADPRVEVLTHEHNEGVGAATLSGYRRALDLGAEVIVKVDGDGQMDLALLPALIQPVVSGHADYAKGNRFYYSGSARGMPTLRLLGNAGLSFLTKMSSGYWQIFDPTNGYTAIAATVARRIVSRPVARRFFFESDLLFHLYLERAVVVDVPMPARYGDETSNLEVWNAAASFPLRHIRNALRRVWLTYFIRDFSITSVQILLGGVLLVFGAWFGTLEWLISEESGVPATAGTVMLAALPIILGFQLLLGAIGADIQNVPRIPIHGMLPGPVATATPAASPSAPRRRGRRRRERAP